MSFVVRSPRERPPLRAVVVHGEVHRTAAVRDISVSGLFVTAKGDVPLEVGQRVAIVPLLDDADGVRFAAEVVRTEGHSGVALRFIDEPQPAGPARRAPAWMRRRPLALVPQGAPEILLADAEPDTVVGTLLSEVHEQHEQRRAQRLARTVVVSVRGVGGGRRLHAIDVATDGLFVVGDHAPRVGAHVHVTLRLPAATLFSIARVTRVVSADQTDTDPGFGLELRAMSDDDRATWSAYVELAASSLAEMAWSSPAVVVRPENLARLRDFGEWDLAAGGTMLFASDLRAPGDGIMVVVVHPKTRAEMRLPAVVVNAHADSPRRMDVCFLQVNETLRSRFHAFVELGHPPPARALPAPATVGAEPPVLEPIGGLADRAVALAAENAKLRARVDELEAELSDAEEAERRLFLSLHAAEAIRK